MSIFSPPWLKKAVGEVRFRPSLEWYGSIPAVAKYFEQEFEHWNAAKPSSIVLFTESKKHVLKLENNLFAYLTEFETEKDSRSQLPKYLQRIAEQLSKEFTIDNALRIGFRTTTIYPSQIKYGELSDLLFSKFYGHLTDLKEISCDRVKDNVFILEAEKNGFSNRVHIGPVKKEEAERNFQGTFPLAVDPPADSFLFADIDIYTQKPSLFADLLGTVKDEVQENFRIQGGYLSFLES